MPEKLLQIGRSLSYENSKKAFNSFHELFLAFPAHKPGPLASLRAEPDLLALSRRYATSERTEELRGDLIALHHREDLQAKEIQIHLPSDYNARANANFNC